MAPPLRIINHSSALLRGAHLTHKELRLMADKTSKTKPRRQSKGQRKHVRRLKQAARKIGTASSQPTRPGIH